MTYEPKFVLCSATLIISALLTWFGKVDGGVFSTVVIATVGAYVAGEVFQRKVEGEQSVARERAMAESRQGRLL